MKPVNDWVDGVYVLTVKTFAERIAHARRELARHAIAFEFVFEHDAPEIGADLLRARFAPSDMTLAQQSLVLKHAAAWRSAVMPEFIASLPVAAIDGTMRRRLRNEGVAGNAHIKTGLLQDVRAMAGYVRDASGRRYTVVMLVNHPNAHQAQAALDSLLRWVYEPPQ